MIAVGSITIMNRSLSTAQRSLEITLVRQQMDAQTEVLRFINQSYINNYQSGVTSESEWSKITAATQIVDEASDFGESSSSCSVNLPENSFIMNAKKAKLSGVAPISMNAVGMPPPYSQVMYNDSNDVSESYGIWIEAVKTNTPNKSAYVDFHIRTCWNSPGSDMPTKLGTIVRLYEPTE